MSRYHAIMPDTITDVSNLNLRGHSDSFRINVESFTTFRDPLYLKQIGGIGLLFGSMVHTIGSSFWNIGAFYM